MKQKIIGNRKGNPAYYDMACRFPPQGITWTYGCPFRIGDKAVAHLQCLMWRQKNPDRKLVVLEDLTQPVYSQGGVEVPADWVFDGIADEIWSAEGAADPMAKPEGEPLYNECLWNYWAGLRDNPPQVKSSITPPLGRINHLLDDLGIPDDFIALNPLFDAPYNSFRNATPGWWKNLAGHLAKKVPIVLIGPAENAKKMETPEGVWPLWEQHLTVLESLATISLSRGYVGGECGPTLWSPVLRKPTVGVYDGFTPWDNWWTRPLSFDGETPVHIVKLGGRSDAIAEQILNFFKL
jgi:hypothetical protein